MLEGFEYGMAKWLPYEDLEACRRVRAITREDITKHPNPDFKIEVMPDEEFGALEKTIIEQVQDGGRFAGDVSEEMGLSQVMLRSLVKRSTKLDYRGHRVEISE